MRALVAGNLRRSGMKVVEARDGDELYAIMRRMAARGRRPDVVLSDVHMPGHDALEAIGELQALHPGVPMVMMTASGNGSTRSRAAELGAAAVLDKPLDLVALRRTITDLSHH